MATSQRLAATNPAGARQRQVPFAPLRRSSRLQRQIGTIATHLDLPEALIQNTARPARRSSPPSKLTRHCAHAKQPGNLKRTSNTLRSNHHEMPSPTQPPHKRHEPAKLQCSAPSPRESKQSAETVDQTAYWTRHYRWPKVSHKPEEVMSQPLTQASSAPSQPPSQATPAPSQCNGTQSIMSGITPSDQRPREDKTFPYRFAWYPTQLNLLGVYMQTEEKPSDEARTLCQALLNKKQEYPQDSLFGDKVFERTCRKLEDRNEARVIQDITRLLVPSAEAFASHGARHLECLIENVNEGWNSSDSMTKPRPQPDYSVGFHLSAFSPEQQRKLQLLAGDFRKPSFFRATYQCYFPFLCCEVKCGSSALLLADRQNANSMATAVRAIVELYRAAGKEKDLDREILAFSFSHDHSTVKIHAWFALCKEEKTTFHRHSVHTFCFPSLEGRDKWLSYRFTKNIYDSWVPKHLDRIRAVIDRLPEKTTRAVPQSTGRLPRTETSPDARAGEHSIVGLQNVTSTASCMLSKESPSLKQSKKRRGDRRRG